MITTKPERYRKGKVVETSIKRLTEMTYANYRRKKIEKFELEKKYNDFHHKMRTLSNMEHNLTDFQLGIENKRNNWQRDFSI